MTKTILITGATDGIGLATVNMLAELGHNLILHGRSQQKLKDVEQQVKGDFNIQTSSYVADLTDLGASKQMVDDINNAHPVVDVVINNAGVFSVAQTKTKQGLDIRFVVNTFAAYLLTREFMKVMPASGRIINLSSAAQAPVWLDALSGSVDMEDNNAYAQSKLALTMFSRYLAEHKATTEPIIIAVNPGSLLASKMVKDAYGIAGNDLSIGARVLTDAALSDRFGKANGLYFDNDSGQFASPHRDALDQDICSKVSKAIEDKVNWLLQQ
ncbi:SDR family NAD(P)-dependent oxidoreductase [Thalassotalea sp. HSM 43]|uniref:SDR family NAD(P)-dependent oxidoreductase n=1 Tax=Thalassotalea sp. HSM 43 TaxID=2552945 RepID=UPI00107FF997|nr:SDR family NAD(P)-dependent oxidoreductase [Thalassotalea sp. HSM 43]QBY05481.1 SDR family NAD(P)-dependent oxidoreductase [Thalassotalea sp. HSM 43]